MRSGRTFRFLQGRFTRDPVRGLATVRSRSTTGAHGFRAIRDNPRRGSFPIGGQISSPRREQGTTGTTVRRQRLRNRLPLRAGPQVAAHSRRAVHRVEEVRARVVAVEAAVVVHTPVQRLAAVVAHAVVVEPLAAVDRTVVVAVVVTTRLKTIQQQRPLRLAKPPLFLQGISKGQRMSRR
jgi:hypothetical protein